MSNITSENWTTLCSREDLVADCGIACWTEEGPVALFWLPDHEPSLFAVSHYDPISRANVLARGIVGDKGGVPVVASPLYKQHFRLDNGQCLEDEDAAVPCYPVRLRQDKVEIVVGQRQTVAA